jgi:hypothetical protein
MTLAPVDRTTSPLDVAIVDGRPTNKSILHNIHPLCYWQWCLLILG